MHCRICGTTESQFCISGKFGCEHCVSQFPYPKSPRRNWIPTSLLLEIEEILQTNPSKLRVLSVRTRITRNLSHTLFPYYEPKEKEVKQMLAENGVLHFLKEEKNIFFLREMGLDPMYRLYLGSEDHLRLEIYQTLDLDFGAYRKRNEMGKTKLTKEKRSLLRFVTKRKLWAYAKDIGFLSSCPTNLGKGRRDSFLLGMKTGIDPRFFSLFEKLSEFGIEFAPSTDHRRESLGNFRGLVVKISWKNAFAVQKRQFYKILGLRGSL
ncbi:ATP--guanido phosphotransferase [Leptospira kemamanensis]|uniref:ATP--guanido phosphotransferase n=1 Tax=Leptospira kemamanensis TaxID=2484942 RepID=A0A4R9JQY3_9LEPT|nr:ATP--guanido phosphotransferase [Leptospira kemamanensis]TGL54544.1 ATP--guanido phosphotransferase [Leptospira kemamanensis]